MGSAPLSPLSATGFNASHTGAAEGRGITRLEAIGPDFIDDREHVRRPVISFTGKRPCGLLPPVVRASSVKLLGRVQGRPALTFLIGPIYQCVKLVSGWFVAVLLHVWPPINRVAIPRMSAFHRVTSASLPGADAPGTIYDFRR